MKTLKPFLAVAALIVGVIVLFALPYNGFFWDHTLEAFIGVLFVAAGLNLPLETQSLLSRINGCLFETTAFRAILQQIGTGGLHFPKKQPSVFPVLM